LDREGPDLSHGFQPEQSKLRASLETPEQSKLSKARNTMTRTQAEIRILSCCEQHGYLDSRVRGEGGVEP
jgi:hypothetical protein